MATDLSRLREPFPYQDVEWRVAQAGKGNNGIWAKVLAYIEARAIMDRLDEVVGPGNWRTEYREIRGALACGISILVEREDGSSEWVTKWDGTGKLATNDGLSESDAGKGDFSNAMKRAGYQWGIGRYLYNLPEDWAQVADRGKYRNRLPQKQGGDTFFWNPPALPDWALPSGEKRPTNGKGPSAPQQAPPTNGKSPDVGKSAPTIPTCPDCGGAVWDNRPKKASGEFSAKSPDFKCRDKACNGAIWPDDERTLADENARKDQLFAAIQIAVNEIKGMSAEDGDAAQSVLDEYLSREKVTAERLVRLQTNIEGKLEAMKKEARAAVAAGSSYDTFSEPFPADDDDLPF